MTITYNCIARNFIKTHLMLDLSKNNAFSWIFIWWWYIQLWHLFTVAEKLKKDKEKKLFDWVYLMRKSQATKFIFKNYQEGLLRDSLGYFKVDGRVKDLLCLIRLYQSTSKPTRHVILLFLCFPLCCLSKVNNQSWGVFKHRNSKEQMGREDRRVRLRKAFNFLFFWFILWSGGDLWSHHAGCCRLWFKTHSSNVFLF